MEKLPKEKMKEAAKSELPEAAPASGNMPEGAKTDFSEEDFAEQMERNMVEKRLQEKYPDGFIRILRRTAYYLSRVGLSLDESLRMVRADVPAMKEIFKNDGAVREYLELKQLEFKADALKLVVDKMREESDSKVAQWLLESKFPDEFGTGKRRQKFEPESGDDPIRQGIEFVREHGDSQPLVSKDAAQGESPKDVDEELAARIARILK